MNKHLANIGYTRDNGADDDRWKRVGRLFIDDERMTASIIIHGWRQGICLAKPFSQPCPFLRGEIVFPIGAKEVDGRPEIEYLFVGFIATNVPDDWNAEPHYAIKFDAMPMTPKFLEPAGLWLDIHLDDGYGWKAHK